MGAPLALLSNYFYLAKCKMAAISIQLYEKWPLNHYFLINFHV